MPSPFPSLSPFYPTKLHLLTRCYMHESALRAPASIRDRRRQLCSFLSLKPGGSGVHKSKSPRSLGVCLPDLGTRLGCLRHDASFHNSLSMHRVRARSGLTGNSRRVLLLRSLWRAQVIYIFSRISISKPSADISRKILPTTYLCKFQIALYLGLKS